MMPIDGKVKVVSVLHIYPEIEVSACKEREITPACHHVCQQREDTVAVLIKDMLPCSELPWYYKRKDKNWFCNGVDISSFDASIPFVLDTMESAYNFYYYGDPQAMKRISSCRGYHRSCQWFFPFILDPVSGFDLSHGAVSITEQLRSPIFLKKKFADVLGSDFGAKVQNAKIGHIMYMASNLNSKASGRSQIVRELQRHIRVDCWGLDQLNVNRSFLSEYKTDVVYQGMEKLAIMAEYKFALAFENSISTDYITEKFWGALATGVVPIVLAHDSIYDYLPDRDAIINIKDFPSLDSLARYLQALINDESLYEKHISWRRQPFSQQFSQFIANVGKTTEDSVLLDICNTYGNSSLWRKPAFDDHRRERKGHLKSGMLGSHFSSYNLSGEYAIQIMYIFIAFMCFILFVLFQKGRIGKVKS